jgi:hypothetical protein
MDPNATLTEIRELTRCITDATDSEQPTATAYHQQTGRDLEEDAIRLALHCAALDQWIARGGFLPADWQRQS